MNDIVVGVLAILTGAVFCFRGYLAMRIIIPLWGAFAGFMLGAGIVSGADGFLGSALGWIVGIALAVVFGLLAYLYYEVAVVIGMLAIGFTLGTSLMVALGVTWSWVIVLAGLALAVVLAFVALVADLPMALLTVLTAHGGSVRDRGRTDARLRRHRRRRLRLGADHEDARRRLVVVRDLPRAGDRRHDRAVRRRRAAT